MSTLSLLIMAPKKMNCVDSLAPLRANKPPETACPPALHPGVEYKVFLKTAIKLFLRSGKLCSLTAHQVIFNAV